MQGPAAAPDSGPAAPERSDVRSVSVLVAVEVCLYRDGLAASLARFPGLSVVGSAADAEQALAAIGDLRPGVVLLDPGMEGSTEMVRAAAEVAPRTRVVALGVREEDQEVLRCAEAGCAGYVSRKASLAELVATIESAAHGELRCPPRIAASLFRRVGALTREQPPADAEAPLTQREREIARLIDEGMSNKEIARRLRIRLSTVKSHVHNILRKLQVGRRGLVGGRARERRAAAIVAAPEGARESRRAARREPGATPRPRSSPG